MALVGTEITSKIIEKHLSILVPRDTIHQSSPNPSALDKDVRQQFSALLLPLCPQARSSLAPEPDIFHAQWYKLAKIGENSLVASCIKHVSGHDFSFDKLTRHPDMLGETKLTRTGILELLLRANMNLQSDVSCLWR